MEKLSYKISCLWGEYVFEAQIAESFSYRTQSDIEGFCDKEGTLADPKGFLALLKEARIENWEQEYDGDNSIEDAVLWNVECVKGGCVWKIKGKEGFWPYGYEKLIEAIRLCDEDIDRF